MGKFYSHLELNAEHIRQTLDTQGLFCLWSLAAMACILAALRFGILLVETAL